MSTVRDKFWIWGHEAGSHNTGWNLQGSSRMTPAEGAYYLGVPNMILVRYHDLPKPPYEQYVLALSPLKRLVWSFVGAGGATDEDELGRVLKLAGKFPNITGAMMDDFFRNKETGDRMGVHTPAQLRAIKDRLRTAPRELDLWVVLYEHQLEMPVSEHLAACDVVTFWTWWARNIKDLEKNFSRAEKLTPNSRKVLGCYMYDYGDKKLMPLDLMEKQCQMGLKWLKDGRIDGMIFLASCICDMGLEAVEWTKKWIAQVGDRPL